MLPRCKSRIGIIFTVSLVCWGALTIRILLHSPPAPVDSLVYRQAFSFQEPLAAKRHDVSLATVSSSAPSLAKAAVLLLAWNRPEAVRRSLGQLLRRRPPGWEAAYPVWVSLDCAHRTTEAVVLEFASDQNGTAAAVAGVLRQPNQGPVAGVPRRERGLAGYYRIARHFRWALDQVFLRLNYTAAILVEDDLDLAPDFYAFFDHLGPLLAMDPSVWCISAWNDNGKADLIEASRSDLFYRTDFFPGLGWMLHQRTWLELRAGWPLAYWDDHLRKDSVRLGRSCVRPEVSRTFTFGRVGVSHGQHFDTFLRHIRLHNATVNYSGLDLTHLTKANYDANFTRAVYRLPLAPSIDVAMRSPPNSSGIRVEYATREEFLVAAKRLGAMADFKYGVPRCAYDGIVPLFRDGRRLFLAPRLPWKGYNTKWK